MSQGCDHVRSRGGTTTTSETGVLLYGDSLFLAGIKAELARCADFELITLRAGATSLPELAGRQGRHTLLFDFAVTAPDFAMPALREHPDLRVIGVDPSSNKILVVTCQSTTAFSIADLVSVIRQQSLPRVTSQQMVGGISE